MDAALRGLAAAAAHNASSPAHKGSDAELAAVHVVGLVGAALFASAAIVVPLALVARQNKILAPRPGGIHIRLPQPLTRLVLQLALLAAGWFFAPLNALLWDGGSVTRVAFNALAWYSTLLELGDYYGLQEPVRSGTYAHYAFVLLAFLALATLGGGVARLTALVGVAPLVALVVLAASYWGAHRDRAVIPPPRAAADVRYGQLVLGWLAALGLFTLVTEACSAEYGGAMPLLGGFVCMLLSHLGLCVLWTAVAFAPAPDPRPSQEELASANAYARAAMDGASLLDAASDPPQLVDAEAAGGSPRQHN